MPKWINRSQSTEARNGTTTHTVTFTAATAGSLLVGVVAGPVTHTWSAGWTEQLQPVNNTELSIATKTASASESSFTITHNSANFPIVWAVYEFPSGSAYGTGTSASGTGTGPTLTGITVGQTVMAAISGVIAASDTSPTAASTWTTPSTEDFDVAVAGNGTGDGAYSTLAYVDSYGSTSLTPAGTYGSSPTREWAVWSLTVPAGDTTAPTVPTGLTTSALGTTTATLTWGASTDAVGVTGYQLDVVGS